jgi:hypothetical protein
VLVTVFPHPALLCGFPTCCARLVYAFAQGLKFLPQSAGYSSGVLQQGLAFFNGVFFLDVQWHRA